MKIRNALLSVIATPLILIGMEQPPHLKPAASTPRRIIIRQKPKPQTQNQPQRNTPTPPAKKAAAATSTVLDINLVLLHRFLDAEINNDRAYLSTRNLVTYQAAINSANNVYNNAYEVAQLQRRYRLSEEQIRRLLNRVIADAHEGIEFLRTEPTQGQEKA